MIRDFKISVNYSAENITFGRERCTSADCKSKVAEFYVEEREAGNLCTLFMSPVGDSKLPYASSFGPVKARTLRHFSRISGFIVFGSFRAPHYRGSFDFKT